MMGKKEAELGCVVEMPPRDPQQEGQATLPVVILLGWAGCKDRHLKKYSTIYLQKDMIGVKNTSDITRSLVCTGPHNKTRMKNQSGQKHAVGCVVIRYTAPWRLVFFSESMGIKSMQNLAKKLLELLFDYKVEMKPLFFHVFSNGGVMLYRYIVDLLHTQQEFQHLKVVGTVFDSAPGRKNLSGALRALSVVLASYNVCVKYALLLTFAVFAMTFRIMLYPFSRFVHEIHYDAMLKQPSRWPELYLYSKADPVILASDVENMAEARRQHQVIVKTVDFIDSNHVSHLRAYPTSYITHCTSFMYSCIGST